MPPPGGYLTRRANVGSNLSRFKRWVKRLVGAVAGRKKTVITVQTDSVVIVRKRVREAGKREEG